MSNFDVSKAKNLEIDSKIESAFLVTGIIKLLSRTDDFPHLVVSKKCLGLQKKKTQRREPVFYLFYFVHFRSRSDDIKKIFPRSGEQD